MRPAANASAYGLLVSFLLFSPLVSLALPSAPRCKAARSPLASRSQVLTFLLLLRVFSASSASPRLRVKKQPSSPTHVFPSFPPRSARGIELCVEWVPSAQSITGPKYPCASAGSASSALLQQERASSVFHCRARLRVKKQPSSHTHVFPSFPPRSARGIELCVEWVPSAQSIAGPKYPCASAGSASSALLQQERASSVLPLASRMRPRLSSASAMSACCAMASRYSRTALSGWPAFSYINPAL